MTERLLWALMACSSGWMAGVAWYTQLVHYPAFRYVRDDRWPDFHAFHSTFTGFVVVGPMLLQAASTLAVVALRPRGWEAWVAVALMAFSFGWTLVVSGPLHGPLSGSLDTTVLDRLIASGWVRAVAWTLQAVFALALLVAPRSI